MGSADLDRINGQPSAALAIRKESSANTVETAAAVKEVFEEASVAKASITAVMGDDEKEDRDRELMPPPPVVPAAAAAAAGAASSSSDPQKPKKRRRKQL